MSQDQKFLSRWSNEVLEIAAKKMMSRGFAFEDAVANTVSELIAKQKPSDPSERVQIVAAGAEVKAYMAEFTKKTGMGPSFLVGALRGRG